MVKAYSYLRFSTPEQMKGDSFRRQREMAEAYARAHGYELDTSLTFHDLGVSAFRGRNVEAGKLADFLEAVQLGLVPQGSVLLVEALDRLSRLVPRKALRVLEDIVDAGVAVVTLNDQRMYTKGSLDEDSTQLLVALVLFMRANEESATKSRRLKQAWEAKRRTPTQRRLTSRGPAWLRPVGTGFELIPERAEVVRRIFKMAREGVGQHRIAETLNAERVPVFGRGAMWHRSYIVKILENAAVIGRFSPHTLEHDQEGKKQRVPQGHVDGYFPPVIDEETFAAVNEASADAFAPRGRHAGQEVRSILAGLAHCALCGSTMTRITKGSSRRAGQPYLICTKAKSGAGCERKHIRYDAVEAAFRTGAEQIIDEAPSVAAVTDLELQLVSTDQEIEELSERARNLLDELEEAPKSGAIRSRLAEVEAALEAAKRAAAALADEVQANRGPVVQHKLGALLSALREGDITTINGALKAVLRGVDIHDRDNEMRLHWKHGGDSVVVMDPLRYLE